MSFHVSTMCSNCPFRRGQSYLRKERAREIARNMASSAGGEFACHKTTAEDEDGDRYSGNDSLHCLGALAFAWNCRNDTQIMRIMGRIGAIDAALVEVARRDAYLSVAAMVRGHAAWERTPYPLKRKATDV